MTEGASNPVPGSVVPITGPMLAVAGRCHYGRPFDVQVGREYVCPCEKMKLIWLTEGADLPAIFDAGKDADSFKHFGPPHIGGA